MDKWPPDGPIKPKKRNNPGKHSLPRVSKSTQKIKHFVSKVFDIKQPLIKPEKVKKEKKPKDKNRYKWEDYYHTDTNKTTWGNKPNPDYGITRQRGKTKGPGDKKPGTTKWKISSYGKDKANYHQPDYPGVRKKKVTTNRNEEGEWEQKSVTRYKRSHSGYMTLSRKDKDGHRIKGTEIGFPSRKELKTFNKESKAKGQETFRAVRKEKTYDNLWDSGSMRQKKKLPPGKDSYVKTYYRGKLRPTIKYY